jgi:hypothetical protein
MTAVDYFPPPTPEQRAAADRAWEERFVRQRRELGIVTLEDIHMMKSAQTDTEARVDAAEVQATYTPAYHHAGLGAAPPRVFGESMETYERRLLRPLAPLSAQYAKANFDHVGDMNAVRAVAAEIRRDAVAAGRRNEGELREVVETDATGRRITRFYGAPGAAWDRFKMPYRFVKSFNGERVF